MPVDKCNSVKNLPHLKAGSKVKYLNFAITKSVVNIFYEILHAGRRIIDKKHIKQDLSLKAWGPRPKFNFFRNMVMVHISN